MPPTPTSNVARETKKAKRERAAKIAAALRVAYPESKCALHHEDPWQLLVATVMSAQTTDMAVNSVTQMLFRRWPTPRTLGEADLEDVGRVIDSIGLWRQKARAIVGLSGAIHKAGSVPRTLEELENLPGVGRKTATAVLGTAFGVAAGVTVDTHMLRINALLELSGAPEADAMADELESILDEAEWIGYTHRIIDHGRLVCVARRPRCGVCPLAKLCPSHGSEEAGYKPSLDEQVPASAAGLSWIS